ncbi:MAG: Phosphatidylinositol-4-phosphate 5-kinase [Pycnora praestabilis]|nr:MAG: Phosphatidylinositol-4-phosphate 5-kinase [Pycnora praestabilis]
MAHFSSPVGATTRFPASSLREENEQLKSFWNDHIHNKCNSNGKYRKVAVLLISWAKGFDDLEVEAEVNKLDDVFKNGFHYKTTRLQIDDKKPAQLLVNNGISTFMCDEFESESLMIIYYAGHGAAGRGPGELNLYGRHDPNAVSQVDSVTWNSIEANFCNAKSDVLIIFDCCSASTLSRNPHLSLQALQYLVPKGTLTAAPGEASFTSALIWALKKLLEESKGGFTVHEVCRKITDAPDLPKHHGPLLSEPLGASVAGITLTPLPKDGQLPVPLKADPERNRFSTRQVALDLSVLFNDVPDKTEIEYLAKHLSSFVGTQAKARTVRWGDLRLLGFDLVTSRFKEITKQFRERRKSGTLSPVSFDGVAGTPVTPVNSGVNRELDWPTNSSNDSAYLMPSLHPSGSPQQYLPPNVSLKVPTLRLDTPTSEDCTNSLLSLTSRKNIERLNKRRKDDDIYDHIEVSNMTDSCVSLSSEWEPNYAVERKTHRKSITKRTFLGNGEVNEYHTRGSFKVFPLGRVAAKRCDWSKFGIIALMLLLKIGACYLLSWCYGPQYMNISQLILVL